MERYKAHSSIVALALFLGYEGLKDATGVLLPVIAEYPLQSSVFLNVTLTVALFQSIKKRPVR